MRFSVLVIDDEITYHKLIDRYLGSDYNVAGAATLNRGIEMMKKIKFDLVMLDLGLEDTDGPIDTIHQFFKLNPTMAVMILTATSDENTMKEAMRKGSTGFISKATLSNLTAWDLQSIVFTTLRRKRAEIRADEQRQIFRDQIAKQFPPLGVALAKMAQEIDDYNSLLSTIDGFLNKQKGVLSGFVDFAEKLKATAPDAQKLRDAIEQTARQLQEIQAVLDPQQE